MQGILGAETVCFNQRRIALALALVVLMVMGVFKRIAGDGKQRPYRSFCLETQRK